MTSSARAKTVAAVVLQAVCVIWLTGCASRAREHYFDARDTRVLDQPLAVVQPSVPRALEALGITVDGQDSGKGKLSFDATSPSGLDVTVKLEAMTSRKTQLAVWVYGDSNFGDWLATEIADAIADDVDRAMESSAQEGAEGRR